MNHIHTPLTYPGKNIVIGILSIILCLVSFSSCVMRDNPYDPESENYISPLWSKTYGHDSDEGIAFIEELDDGFIFVGSTESFGVGNGDALLVKLDDEGEIEWQKTYGGSAADSFKVIHKTYDDGYIIGGESTSFTLDTDIWILRTDQNGDITWEYAYGLENGSDYLAGIYQISDGFIIAGTLATASNGQDFWLLKINNDGDIQWQYRYGSTGIEWAYDFIVTHNNDYMLVGTTTMNTGYDILVLVFNNDGSLFRQRYMGGDGVDKGSNIHETSDSRYLLSGMSTSYNSAYDSILVKFTDTLIPLWCKTYDNGYTDIAYRSIETLDSGFFVSNLVDIAGTGDYDAWLLKLDADGAIEWQKRYYGEEDDRLYEILETDNGYLLPGSTTSFGSGNKDGWIVSIDDDGDIPDLEELQISTTDAMVTTQTIDYTDPGLTAVAASAVRTETSAVIQDSELVVDIQ